MPVTTKTGQPAEKVDVKVFDDTFEVTLTLWGRTCASAPAWKPSHTLLLISNAKFRDGRRPEITTTAETHLEVDPEIRDAEWLRDFARKLATRDHVNPLFPVDGMDVRFGPRRASNP